MVLRCPQINDRFAFPEWMRINHGLNGSLNGFFRRRHSLSLLPTPRNRLVSDKHNGDSMTKSIRMKTLHSVLSLHRRNIPYKYCDSVDTRLPLTPSVFVCGVHVVRYRMGLPGVWRAWGSGVGRRWPSTQNWRKGKQTLIVFITAARVDRSRTGLDGRCAGTCFWWAESSSPSADHWICWHALRKGKQMMILSQLQKPVKDPVKLKTIWKTFTKD